MCHAYVREDEVKFKLSPFSLERKGKSMAPLLSPNSIALWTDMVREFLTKNSRLTEPTPYDELLTRKDNPITGVWNVLMNSSSNHDFELWHIIGLFYDGLSSKTHQSVKLMCNNVFLRKALNEA